MARQGVARRLAVVAGSVLACALASLPFAGSRGDRFEGLDTVGGAPSAAPLAAPAPAASGAAVELAWAPIPAEPAAADPPPEEPPPLPPVPDDAAADPSVGVVRGDAAVPSAVPVGPPEVAGGPVAPNPEGERVWAVVIGIDDYPGTRSDLHAATADAGDLVGALLRFGVPADQVRPVYDRAATVDGVLDAVAWLVEHAGPEDTAVFLYAGHVRDLGDGTEAIVTAEAGWITDWFLADRFAGLAARDAWFVVAACYGGGFDELLAPGRVLTAAAAPGELAYENDAYGRSYLAEFVLRRGLLEGSAGDPTVQAAVAWGADQLAEHHPERQLWNSDQAGHVISLDGIRRDGPAPPETPPPDPGSPSPAGGDVLTGTACFLGLCPG